MTHALQKCEPGKHEYEPRYDEKVSDVFGAVLKNLKDKIYLYDVCRRCGDIVQRKK